MPSCEVCWERANQVLIEEMLPTSFDRCRAHMPVIMVVEMEREVTEKIRQRAYEPWVASGSLDGQSEVNWLAAEREVLASRAAKAVKKQAPKKSARGILGLQTRAGTSKSASRSAP